MMDFFIPVVTFNNDDYLLIDQGDIEYWWPGDKPVAPPPYPEINLENNGTTSTNWHATTT